MALAILASMVGGALAAPSADAAPVMQRVIVLTDPELGAGAAATQVESTGGDILHAYRSAVHGYAALVPSGSVDAIREAPGVISVELDQRGRGADDQQPAPSWGLDRIDQRTLPLNGTYSYGSGGAGVTNYIFDSGVRLTHREFSGRIRTGPDFIDDDASSDDCNGHGTRVAGTAAGTTYGVAKQAQVVAVRVLDCNANGWYSDWIAAIDWINADHSAGTPAVVNASLGGTPSTALNTAVSNSIADGIVWVIAAGNYNTDACNRSPASVPEAITVGATDATDTRASFSNYGSCVDLFAPGVNITSAGIASDTAVRFGGTGTSASTPHVVGAVSRYLGHHPAATVTEATDAVLTAATPDVVGDPLSANRLLYVDPTVRGPAVPGAPTGVTGQVTSATTASISWTPPISAGSSPVTGYLVARDGGTAGHPAWSTTVSASARNQDFANLLAGSTYTLSVAAINAAGTGPATILQVAIPTLAIPTLPRAPDRMKSPRVVVRGNKSIVKWTAATPNGSAISRYLVDISKGRDKATSGSARKAVFKRLKPGRYKFRIAAVNAIGRSPYSAWEKIRIRR